MVFRVTKTQGTKAEEIARKLELEDFESYWHHGETGGSHGTGGTKIFQTRAISVSRRGTLEINVSD